MQIDPKPRCGGSLSFTVMLLLIIGADFAVGRPDVRESPFALELQPPLLQPDVTFSAAQGGGDGPKAIDSYGNPIDALRPIDTPDGRKVVSAQGVQFEIPTYASGITEIRRPADDLLPPHIGELTSTRAAAASGATTRTETETETGNRTKNETKTNALTAPHTTKSSRSRASTNSTSTSTRTALAAPISTTNKLAKRDSLGGQFPIAPPSNHHAPPSFSLIKLNPFAGLDSPITQIGSHSSPSPSRCPSPSPSSTPRTSSLPLANANCSKYSTPNPNPLQPDAIAVGLEPSTDQKPNPIPIPNSFTGTASASAPAPLPATSLTPPHHDPSPDTTTTAEVEVEQAHLVPLPQEDGSLPEYIRELQREDPNIGGPVSWKPAADGAPLSVIAWDLLPPHQEQENHRAEEQAQEPTIITEAQQQPAKKVQGIVDPISHNIRFSLSSGGALSPEPPQPQAQEHHQGDGPAQHGTNAHVGSTTPGNPSRFPNRQRGTAHYTTRSSSTTARPRTTTSSTTSTTTTTTRATTTTTKAPTTTTRAPTTTTRRTTTARTTTAKPETRTVSPVSSTSGTTEDPGTFYSLENKESYAYTLPTWLQEVTDPDLDVAVTFEVPADNDQYNHTLASDLEPPFEPFIDLGNIQLTPPPTSRPTTTTTARATTTRTTTTTTAAPTTTTTTTTRTTTTTPRTTTTTTTTRRPSTQRTTKAPIPTPPTHSTQAHHPEPPPVKLTTTTTHHHADTPPEDSSSSGSSSSGSFTTNTTPSQLDAGNPFDSATIPAWLRDFDYPDVGPGVPFDPDNFGPAASSTRSPTTLPRLPTFPTASSAFPSKVTLPLPGSSSSSSGSSSEEPPLVLIPPADRSDSVSGSGFASAADSNPGPLTHPTTNSITPFAARFEPPASSQNQIQPAGSSASSSGAEPFPPSKFEYTKSDEGKVISTPVANNQRKTETAPPASNTGKYTGGFGAPAGLLRPQSTNPSGPNSSGSSNTDIYVAGNQHEFSTIVKGNKLRPTVNPGRYNGGFGAPTGVLSPQPQSTSQSQSQAEPRPFQPVHQQAEHRDRPSGGNRRTDSRFGGPPGILVPFDNVQRTGGQ